MRLLQGLPSLRNRAALRILWECFARGSERAGFAVCEFSIQRDHLHLIVEACGREVLSRGMQGLAVRIARALNRLWSRKGTVFGDRYHDRVLRSPREVRNALVYVLQNGHKHAKQPLPHPLDPFSSALWFPDWNNPPSLSTTLPPRPTPIPKTWLLAGGWKRTRGRAGASGLLSIHERPTTKGTKGKPKPKATPPKQPCANA